MSVPFYLTLLLATACANESAGDVPFEFAGVSSVQWDGADGLIVEWDSATGDPDAYRVELTAVANGATTNVETPTPGVTLDALAEGEYDVRVVATQDAVESDGSRSLRQLVGPDRFAPVGVVDGGCWEFGVSGSVVGVVGMGARDQVGIVDASDPAAPVLASSLGPFLDPLFQVAAGDDLLFVASRAQLDGVAIDPVGVAIYDIRDIASPVLLAEVTEPAEAHHVAYADQTMWISVGSPDRELWAYDMADPTAPRLLGTWEPPSGSPDEIFARGGSVWVTWQMGIAELGRDGDSIVERRSWLSPGRVTHSLFPLSSGEFLVSAPEEADGGVDLWDLRSDPPTLSATLVQAMPYPGPVSFAEEDGFLFMNAREGGVYAFDLTDPSAPTGPYVQDWNGNQVSYVESTNGLLALCVAPGPTFVRFYPSDGRGLPASDVASP